MTSYVGRSIKVLKFQKSSEDVTLCSWRSSKVDYSEYQKYINFWYKISNHILNKTVFFCHCGWVFFCTQIFRVFSWYCLVLLMYPNIFLRGAFPPFRLRNYFTIVRQMHVP